MHWHYDEDGSLQTTENAERAARKQALVMLSADNYALSPQAVPGLSDFFGPAPDQTTVTAAKARVRQALDRMGLEDVSADAALGRLDGEWRMKVEVGRRA